MSKILIISPSGNFYGSEQVLFDYLQATRLILTVVLPVNSKFFKLLKESNLKHRVKQFKPANLKFFYALLFMKLFFGKFSTVYLNEAGHIRYINLLSKIFKNKNFVVHVRLVEDTNDTRWNGKEKTNLKVIAISKYIQNKLPVKSALLYDPYNFNFIGCSLEFKYDTTKLRIGIIGRVTYTKGADILHQLLTYLDKLKLNKEFDFFFYGEPSQDVIDTGLFNDLHNFSNVHFKGFVLDKNKIYNNIDCVLHASPDEPLGRIFLEAVDYGKPLIGLDAAGIGEIGCLLNLQDLLVNPSSSNIISLLKDNLQDVKCNYDKWSKRVLQQKKKAFEIFNMVNYVDSVEKFLV
jgi:hypothetical protein